jgi:hypothetical protein
LRNPNINPVNIKSLLCVINPTTGQKYKYKSQIKFFNEKIEESHQLIYFHQTKQGNLNLKSIFVLF